MTWGGRRAAAESPPRGGVATLSALAHHGHPRAGACRATRGTSALRLATRQGRRQADGGCPRARAAQVRAPDPYCSVAAPLIPSTSRSWARCHRATRRRALRPSRGGRELPPRARRGLLVAAVGRHARPTGARSRATRRTRGAAVELRVRRAPSAPGDLRNDGAPDAIIASCWRTAGPTVGARRGDPRAGAPGSDSVNLRRRGSHTTRAVDGRRRGHRVRLRTVENTTSPARGPARRRD